MRTYALFLEERLECFKILRYDIEAERLPRPAQGQEKVCGSHDDLLSLCLVVPLLCLCRFLILKGAVMIAFLVSECS